MIPVYDNSGDCSCDAPLPVTRQGKPFIKEDGSENAFDNLWQRFMRKALDHTDLTVRFQERDLRAKVASESASLEEAILPYSKEECLNALLAA